MPARKRILTSATEFEGDPFQRDLRAIYESKAFRRAAYKTQTIADPENPHQRTRLSHTLEVASLVSGICGYLTREGFNINPNLAGAIAMAHDIGHVPYGHAGEFVMEEFLGERFDHGLFGAIVAQEIERKGGGLNLTADVLKGVIAHSMDLRNFNFGGGPSEEANLVKIADKIAYTCADLNDAIRARYVSEAPECAIQLGDIQRSRVKSLGMAVVDETLRRGTISFSEGKEFERFRELRTFLTDVFYMPKREVERLCQEQMRVIYNWFEGRGFDQPALRTALLTDKSVATLSHKIMHSSAVESDLIAMGLEELMEPLKDKPINMTKIDLDWSV